MADDTGTGTIRYGRKKLDADAYAKQTAAKEREGRQATRYGANKSVKGTAASLTTESTGDPDANAAAKGPQGGDAGTGTRLSIPKLKAALDKNPGLFDTALALEIADDKPRRGALELFFEVESEKETPREDVIERLTAALE